jgi:hypothetical protein
MNLDREIEKCIAKGVTTFICGGALGFDQIAASLVITKKEMGRKIRLVFALPCKNQEKLWNAKEKTLYRALLKEADDVIYVSEDYDLSCIIAPSLQAVGQGYFFSPLFLYIALSANSTKFSISLNSFVSKSDEPILRDKPTLALSVALNSATNRSILSIISSLLAVLQKT